MPEPFDPNRYSTAALRQVQYKVVTNDYLLQLQQQCAAIGLSPAGGLNVPKTTPVLEPVSRYPYEPVADVAGRDNKSVSGSNVPGGYAVQTKTSNLTQCPNGVGDNEMSCWLMSSGENIFARHNNLNMQDMPGEKEPTIIYGPESDFMKLTGFKASRDYAVVDESLYHQPVLPSELRVATGIMVNSYTGQAYETFEDDVPPPNTNRQTWEPYQMQHTNPKLVALQGGYDSSQPYVHKVEVAEDQYGPDAGRNVFGEQLYADRVRVELEQRNTAQTFNNRDGQYSIEPAWDKRPMGFVGQVFAPRYFPYLPATERSLVNTADPFRVMDWSETSKQDAWAPPNMELGHFGRRDREASGTGRDADSLRERFGAASTDHLSGPRAYDMVMGPRAYDMVMGPRALSGDEIIVGQHGEAVAVSMVPAQTWGPNARYSYEEMGVPTRVLQRLEAPQPFYNPQSDMGVNEHQINLVQRDMEYSQYKPDRSFAGSMAAPEMSYAVPQAGTGNWELGERQRYIPDRAQPVIRPQGFDPPLGTLDVTGAHLPQERQRYMHDAEASLYRTQVDFLPFEVQGRTLPDHAVVRADTSETQTATGPLYFEDVHSRPIDSFDRDMVARRFQEGAEMRSVMGNDAFGGDYRGAGFGDGGANSYLADQSCCPETEYIRPAAYEAFMTANNTVAFNNSGFGTGNLALPSNTMNFYNDDLQGPSFARDIVMVA